MRKSKITLLLVLTCLIIVNCTSVSTSEQQALKEAYQRSWDTYSNATLTGDTSQFHQVFSTQTAEERTLTLQKNLSVSDTEPIFFTEIETEWIKVLEYSPDEAIIVVQQISKKDGFYNRQTGEFSDLQEKGGVRWDKLKVRMVKEDGVWKRDQILELLDWGYHLNP